MILKILVTFFTLIITIFVFQNCSNSSNDSAVNLNASLSEKTEYSEINFLEYYPNYFKTISPSKILAVSNTKKILIESTMVEHPGLIEIDVIQNLKYKKIENMPSNSNFSYSFDGHYLLALADSLYIYNTSDLSLVRKINGVVKIYHYKHKEIGLLISENGSTVNKLYNISENNFYTIPSEVVLSEISFLNDSENIYYVNTRGVWRHNYQNNDLENISDLFTNKKDVDLVAVDESFLYLNSSTIFKDSFYYDSSTIACELAKKTCRTNYGGAGTCFWDLKYMERILPYKYSQFFNGLEYDSYNSAYSSLICPNYIYRINLKTKKISYYPENVENNLNVKNTGELLLAKDGNDFLLIDVEGKFFKRDIFNNEKMFIPNQGVKKWISSDFRFILQQITDNNNSSSIKIYYKK